MADEKPKKVPKQISAELTTARSRLASFLGSNPTARVVEINISEGPRRAILKAWNDESLAFDVPDDDADFDRAFNSIILPERLTAVFHKDNKALEVIWTAYTIDDADINGREFTFTYDGQSHNCRFARSSDVLLKIASHFIPLRMSHTSFRNLQSFSFYAKRGASETAPGPSIGEPLSFWIDNLGPWDIDRAIELVNNLNFYLSYYDDQSPTVLIHPIGEDEAPITRNRYLSGKFPKSIRGKRLDNNLLSFWQASGEGDPARRFQYYYRIIEYASFSYLEGSARLAVRRILADPDGADNVNEVTERLMAAFQMSKLDEYTRFAQLVSDTVTAKILWSEIKQNLPAFSKEIAFDGGFKLKPIVASSTKETTFAPKGVELFTKAIRDIRNALAHGRDYKSATVIMPTQRNLQALQPWVHLIAVAAGQVILFRDVS